MKYCTYLTIYKGTLLPKRYIGSTTVEKVLSGYNGSVSSKEWEDIFRKEQIENKHLFRTRILKRFETRLESIQFELELQIKYQVVKNSNYMNKSLARPKGFFGMDVTGSKNPMYGRVRKGERHWNGENVSKSLKKMYQTEKGYALREHHSNRMKGENNHMFNKNHSEETRKKMSDSHSGENNHMFNKNHSEETRKKMSEIVKEQYKNGRIPFNKGKPISEKMLEILKRPKSEEHKQKLRKIYLYDGKLIKNAKEYCEENGHNYVSFTQAEKKYGSYKGKPLICLNKNDLFVFDCLDS